MDTRKPVSLAIVGPFSSGKSTLLNALVGEAVQSMGVLPETSMLSHLTWSATRGGRIHLADGRTVDGTFEETRARVMEIEQSGGAGTVDHVEHSLPKTFLQHLHLWDTPGLNSTYLHHEIVAERAIRTADIIVWVTPIDAAITREEVEKIAKRKPPKTPLLVVVNKIDVADEGELADALAGIRKDLEGVVTTVQPVAARAALDRAEGAASEFRGDDGIAGLRQAIAGFVSAAQHERAWPAGIARSLKASEFECPTCSEACDASDKYCVCGRDLADQHRECPRCAGDNIMRRDRCRQCNVVFAVAEQSDEVERQAIEDLAHFALTDASVKLRAAVELDSSVPGRVGLRDAIGKAATQLQDIVDGVANFLRDGDARWFAEAVRADSLLPVSALKVALHFASSGPYATKAQRQRRQLCEQWVCSKSAFEAVLFGVKDDIIRVLGYAWMLAASFELQETAKARHIADSLASATCVIEWESMGSRKDHGSLEMHKIAALVLSACDATEQEDYERALCCLESAAVEPSLLERLLAVARRAGELCAARDARDATIGDIVAKLVSEGYSALEGGRLSLVKECARKADNAALTASVSRRGALRSASMLLVERVDLALEESRKLSRQAEECNGREEFEEQIRLLTLAAETNVAYRDTLLTARQEYRSKLAAREARNAALARVLVGFSRRRRWHR